MQAEFERLFTAQVVPLMRGCDIDMVFAGASLHERDSFVLIRAYAAAMPPIPLPRSR